MSSAATHRFPMGVKPAPANQVSQAFSKVPLLWYLLLLRASLQLQILNNDFKQSVFFLLMFCHVVVPPFSVSALPLKRESTFYPPINLSTLVNVLEVQPIYRLGKLLVAVIIFTRDSVNVQGSSCKPKRQLFTSPLWSRLSNVQNNRGDRVWL